MTYFLNQIMNGVTSGMIYASLGIALVLIYRSTSIVNFAQGEMATLSTLIAWQLVAVGVPLMFAFLLALAAAAAIAAILYMVAIRPVQKSEELTIVIVTIGLFLAINSVSGAMWGYLPKSLPSLFPRGSLNIDGVRITSTLVGSVVVVAVAALVLYLLFQRTRLGLALRAAATNPESSRLCGISVTYMMVAGWALSGIFGTLSGILVAPQLSLDPNMMFTVIVYAFSAAIIGGLASYIGVVLGGVIVGISQSLSVGYLTALGSEFQVIVPLILIICVLIVKPQGLFGKTAVVRV